MAQSALPQAPHRQDRKTFPTPLIGDVLFSEVRDCNRIAIPAYGTAHPDTTKWPNHKLVYVKPVDIDRNEVFEFFYAADRSSQDNYNWAFTQADIGGTKFNAVERTYVTLRSAFSSTTPIAGATMPNVPVSLFSGTYVLARRGQQRIGEQVLDSLYVVDVHTYIKRCSIRTIGVDSNNGKPLTATDVVYYATEVVTGSTTAAALFADSTNAYWGLQTNGDWVTGSQLSCDWYVITTSQQVAGTLTGSVVAVMSYTTNIEYSLPPVLEQVDFLTWARREGGDDIRVALRFNPEGYRGPCSVAVVVTWSKTAFTLGAPVELKPTRINYSAPFFEVNIPESLHTAFEFHCDIGTSDPVYKANYNSGRLFPATSPTTWPATMLIDDDQQPYKGGFLRTTRTLTTPTVTAAGTWAPTIPVAPTALTATATTSTNINLTWTCSATDETSFAVERKIGSGPFALIATLAANSTAYSDASVVASTTYIYRVRSYRGTRGSTYSATATATTPP